MSSLTFLIQVLVDLFFLVTVVVLWIQFRRPKSEDPRMAAGLQELQSKISVLEDLGDRTERQVQQLMTILENKLIDVQKKIDQADNMQGQISKSMEKSLEVAKIFQDKIPHEEIHERQNTIKFVKAAILANQGCSLTEISEKVDLPYGELEFIVKVNKNELSFDETQLPDWIQTELKDSQIPIKEELQFIDSPLQSRQKIKTNAGLTSADQQALHNLGEKFRQAQVSVSQKNTFEPEQRLVDKQMDFSPVDLRRNNQAGLGPKPEPFDNESDFQQRRVTDTVQRLVNQKKRELEALWVANLESSGDSLAPAASATGTTQAKSVVQQVGVASQVRGLQSGSGQAAATQSSLVVEPGQPYYLGQESKILKKGINLGIRPVVFPRIEVNKK